MFTEVNTSKINLNLQDLAKATLQVIRDEIIRVRGGLNTFDQKRTKVLRNETALSIKSITREGIACT